MTILTVAPVCDRRFSPLIGRRYKKECHYILKKSVMAGGEIAEGEHSHVRVRISNKVGGAVTDMLSPKGT